MLKISNLEQVMNSTTIQQSIWDKIKKEMARSSVLEEAMKSVAAQQSIYEKVREEMARTSALEQAMKSIATTQSIYEKIREEAARTSALEQAMKSVATTQSIYEKIRAEMARTSAFEQVMKSVTAQQSIWEKIKKEIARPSATEQYLKVIARSREILIDQPNIISLMAESVTVTDLESEVQEINNDSLSVNFEEVANLLNNTPDANSFLDVFSKLPGFFKTFILFLIMHVVLNQVNSISANLLTPVVQEYLGNLGISKGRQVSQIKNLATPSSLVGITNIRFITGNNVRVRESSSTNSKIIDELEFGQIVTVLSKNRNWIEVIYEYENGEVLRGWVFTRYTAKFKK